MTQNKICMEVATKWIPDDCVTECMQCGTAFGIMSWKHHCRQCGYIFCSTCTSNLDYVAGYADQKVKVCDGCHKDITRLRKIKCPRHSVISSYFADDIYLMNYANHIEN